MGTVEAGCKPSLRPKDCEFSPGAASITTGPNTAYLISPALQPAPDCLKPLSPTPTHKSVVFPSAVQTNQACGPSRSSWLRFTFLAQLPLLLAIAPRVPQSNFSSSLLYLCLWSCCPQALDGPPFYLIFPDPAKMLHHGAFLISPSL